MEGHMPGFLVRTNYEDRCFHNRREARSLLDLFGGPVVNRLGLDTPRPAAGITLCAAAGSGTRIIVVAEWMG
jgi:hypothetical protein